MSAEKTPGAVVPGSPEWHARIELMREQEGLLPEQWWYMSFVKDGRFAGACLVRARGPVTAMQEAHRQGCNPGGEIMYFPVGQERDPSHPPNRLLSRAELGPGLTVGELEDSGILPGRNVGFTD